MRSGLTLAAAVAVVLLAPARAHAQYVHGRVVDIVTGRAISAASVLIVNPDNSIRSGGITDADGRFGFGTTPGSFRLRVTRVGYAPTGSKDLGLTRRDTLSFDVRLALRPSEVEGMTVRTSAAPLDPSGFFARRDEHAGRFLGPYEVERRHPNSPADLLHDIPGYSIHPGMGGFRVVMTGRNRRCVPTVYVDGRLAHRGTQTDRLREPSDEEGVFLESLVNANAIRALEAYQSGATAPVRFRPVGPIGGGDCGVLVFWTRHGLGR